MAGCAQPISEADLARRTKKIRTYPGDKGDQVRTPICLAAAAVAAAVAVEAVVHAAMAAVAVVAAVADAAMAVVAVVAAAVTVDD